jgi:hypothetical protein
MIPQDLNPLNIGKDQKEIGESPVMVPPLSVALAPSISDSIESTCALVAIINKPLGY